MASGRRTRIALVWAQFAAYHIDRCEAVARRLQGCEVVAVEVSTSSRDYAWEPSGAVAGAAKITLFPGENFNAITSWRRFRAMFAALRRCDTICFGLGYDDGVTILLSWLLRVLGKRVVVFSESKFDDRPRRLRTELVKVLALASYNSAIVGGLRHIAYFRWLGFRRRLVLPGYDGVSLDRIRAQAGVEPAPGGVAFETRPFVYVGRFVAKKNLIRLIEGYALHAHASGAGTGEAARRLVLIGSGEDEPAMRARIAALGVTHLVDFPGFLSAEAVSRMLAGALALVLVSTEEQWGLVVNEALACGLPAIVSTAVGSRDALVRNLVNGFTVEPGSPAAIAAAMNALASDRELWTRMVAASHQRAWMGDTDRLADAIELTLGIAAPAVTARIAAFIAAMEN